MSFNKNPDDPNLSELLALHKKDIMLSMNCHAIARIESFDPVDQTASAVMMYKKTYYEQAENGEYKEKLVSYPVLLDCPVVVLSGGDVSLKMPVKEGDECLVMFNDRSIDRWFESGQIVSLESPRLHSFSDGILLVGLRSTARSLDGYEDDKAVLGDSESALKVGAGEASLEASETIVKVATKVTIENNAENLNSLLQDLIGAIQGITVTGVTSGPSASGPPANVATFSAIAARIGSLLE